MYFPSVELLGEIIPGWTNREQRVVRRSMDSVAL
jgi:hypothetical protein